MEHNCNYCGKLIFGTYNLNTHEATHTGEKKYKCEHPGCSFSAAHKSNLKVHQNKPHQPPITSEEAAKILLSLITPITKSDGKRRKKKRKSKNSRRTIKRKSL
jgi:hypothetical protein